MSKNSNTDAEDILNELENQLEEPKTEEPKTQKTKTELDDQLIDAIHPAIYKTILYIGFYI